MKQRIALVLALCLMAGAAAAETAAERGKRVVNEALQALGGDAYLHMEDRVETGRAYSFYREELSGLSIAKVYTRYLTLPAPPVPGTLYVRERDVFGKDGSDVMLFNERGAWEVTFHGARPLPDTRYAQYQDSTLRNIFYILRQRLNEPGILLYSRGSDIYQNLPVEIVDITGAGNRTVTVYFSRTSKLPVRQVYKRRNQQFKDWDQEVTLFAKYRDVGGGVMWPFDVRRERNGEKLFEMYADSVEINRNLTDDLFTLPGDVKVLPKQK